MNDQSPFKQHQHLDRMSVLFSLSLSHTHKHSHIHSHTFSLCHAHHIHTLTHKLTHIHTHSLSVSHTHSHFLSLSLIKATFLCWCPRFPQQDELVAGGFDKMMMMMSNSLMWASFRPSFRHLFYTPRVRYLFQNNFDIISQRRIVIGSFKV